MVGTETLEGLIKASLIYTPETGSLMWRHRPEILFVGTDKRSSAHIAANWNAKNAGKEAFTAVGKHGYRTGTLFKKRLLLHRVAFVLQTGSWPTQTVDHINGDRLDNRWANLRDISKGNNNRNAAGYAKTSPYIGVSWNKSLGGYVAKVYHNGASHYCGFSKDDPAKVAQNRDAKAKELFGKYARLNFPEERAREWLTLTPKK